ncbi:uncharacterized protein [Diadema setosum]|uniref:uncharacterized protein n=1 Tax=Diadema setosum TaxID=31175 RepID=UPI003B3B1F93
MDLIRGERDPTMDTRIVHSVSVSNKKEQATLRHKERSLKSAKDVEEHIHRREEKDLLRHLTKLQDEKCKRHPDIFNSRSRVQSRLSGGRPNSNMILQVDDSHEHSGRGSLTSGKSMHNAAIRTSFHRAPGTGIPPSDVVDGPAQRAFIHRRQSSNFMSRGGLGAGPSVQNAVLSSGLRPPAGGSRHTGLGISPQLSVMTTDTIPRPPEVHQPAGYGHTMKEHVQREGLNKRRPHHAYMEPRGSNRRTSVCGNIDDFMKGSHLQLSRPSDAVLPTGSRFMLNMPSHDQVPGRSSHAVHLGPSLHRTGESVHTLAMGPSCHQAATPSRFQINRLFGGLSVKEVAAELQRSISSASDDTASTDSKNEIVIKIGGEDDTECSDHEVHTKVHFKEDSEDRAEKGQEEEQKAKISTKQGKSEQRGKSDHVVTTRKASYTKVQDRKKSGRSAKANVQKSAKAVAPAGVKPKSKSVHGVKLSSEAKHKSSEDSKTTASTDDKSAHGHAKNINTKKHADHIQIPSDTLQELRAALGNNLPGDIGTVDDLLALGSGQTAPNVGSSSAYDPSSNSMQNRRFRARLRALQYINSQMEAIKQQHANNPKIGFDPVELLRCRYLRLSKSNIDTLTDLCHEMGVEVGLHPHMTIDDVSKFVFESHESDAEDSAGMNGCALEKVLI